MKEGVTIEGWQAGAAAIVLILGVIFKFVLDVLNNRKEREASRDRLQVLKDIAISNQAIREGQVAQNGKLSSVVSVNQAHHEELIRAIQASCKARPIFDQQQTNKIQT